MADKEHTNNEMFKDKIDMFQRDKALLEAYLEGKVSCPHQPHHSFSKDKEWFYKPGKGLKMHYGSSHQGQEETKYDESLINREAFMLLRKMSPSYKQFLDDKCEQASATWTLNGSCCYSAVPGVC